VPRKLSLTQVVKLANWSSEEDLCESCVHVAADSPAADTPHTEDLTDTALVMKNSSNALEGTAYVQHGAAPHASPASQHQSHMCHGLRPRILVQCKNGRGFELLSVQDLENYAAPLRGTQGVYETRSASELDQFVIHRFCKVLETVPSSVRPMPVAETSRGQPSQPLLAMASLKMPSHVYPAITTGLALPRIAVCPRLSRISDPAPTVLCTREFIQYTALSSEMMLKCEQAATEYTKGMGQTSASMSIPTDQVRSCLIH
jgi:hypothetical protein